jgi:ligand-binding sensor domain-containing protein/DNA-binding NarL/FixJ family response regulator
MKYAGILIGLALFSGNLLLSQQFPEKGLPPLHNYAPEQYAQAGKAWAIRSAANGLVYLATDKGLLEFDGDSWRRFSGSKGFTRSLLVLNDSVMYTGADKDFGVWHRSGWEGFSYQSLYPFRESAKGLNEEFWGVYLVDGEVVFVSFQNVYVQKAGQLTKMAAPFRFYKSFQTGGTLYLADEKYGLYSFDGLSLVQVFAYPAGQSWQIMGVNARDSRLLITTRNQGLFTFENGKLSPWSNEVSPYLERDQVFSFCAIGDSHFAFGTILNGLYITDREGRIIQHLNKQKGILNNTILSMHYSKQGTLWLGMDYGVTALHLSSQVAYVPDQQGAFGTGQAALLHGTEFYLGTNQGLYFSEWEELKNDASGIQFALVPGSAGQVWTLQALGGDLWCGHDRGLFRISPRGMAPVYTREGVLAITPLGQKHLVTGTYNGLALFRREGNDWVFESKLPPVQGACSQVLNEKDSLLWVNIPNYGIIKAYLNDGYRIARQRIYLAQVFEGEHPSLALDSLGVHLHTSRQTYTYHAGQDSFLRSEQPFVPQPVRNSLPVQPGGIPLNADFRFFPVYNGFALYQAAPARAASLPAALVVRSLAAFNNDTLMPVGLLAKLPFHLNNIRVHFLVPQQPHAQYRYKLTPYHDEWSAWTDQTRIDFLHLPEGNYTLWLEARADGQVLHTAPVYFGIVAPWYRRWYAYLGYLLLLSGLFFVQRLRHNAKLTRLKTALQAQERLALEKQAEAFQKTKLVQTQQRLEAEVVALQKQLRAKTIELAKKGKENEDKNRLLQTLKDKINAIENRSSEGRVRWAEMSRLLDTKMTSEDHTFEMQLDELHQDFLRQLKARFPKLSTYDLRLATYLKMGLSSREIAEIMNVLPSSVNVSRSRLRKKMDLDENGDLYEFLNGM